MIHCKDRSDSITYCGLIGAGLNLVVLDELAYDDERVNCIECRRQIVERHKQEKKIIRRCTNCGADSIRVQDKEGNWDPCTQCGSHNFNADNVEYKLANDPKLKEKIYTKQELVDERTKIYGDPYISHQAIGLAWEAVLRNRYHILQDNSPVNLLASVLPGHLFPADLVAEMLAAFKIVRLARPQFHKDSADDAITYIEFSTKFREKK